MTVNGTGFSRFRDQLEEMVNDAGSPGSRAR